MLLRMTSAEFRDYISKMPENTMLVVEFDNGEDDAAESSDLGVNAVEIDTIEPGEEDSNHD